MIDLKAELFRKQEDVKRLKLTNVSYMKGRPASSDIKKKNIWSKHNVGVAARSERDLEQKMEEEDSLEKSKRMLEKKAKLYDEMTNSEVIPDEDGSRVYLVDFQKKVIDKVVEKREEERRRDEEKEDSDISESTDPLEQWVDYTDNLGRSRRCLRKDLPHFIERETSIRLDSGNISSTEKAKATLLSRDMERELQRQKWEQEAEEELNKPVGPIHYANVQHSEVRTHGVGFYQFSKDEDMRKQQLEMLKTMREQTVDQRVKRGQIKDKRKIQLDTRLAKVRQRRQQREGGDILPAVSAGGGEDDLEPMQEQDGVEEDVTTVTDTNTAQTAVETSEVCDEKPVGKVPAKVREWDKGKRPEMFETFERRRTRLEDERIDEFAPPSFYKGDRHVNTPRTASNKTQSERSSLRGTTIGKGRNDPQPPRDVIANTLKNPAKSKNDELNEIPLPPQESSSNDIDLFLRSCKGVVSKETNCMATGDIQMTSNSLIGQTPDPERHSYSTSSVVFDPTKPPPSFQTTVQAQMTSNVYPYVVSSPNLPYVQENDPLYSQTNLTIEKSHSGYTNPTFIYTQPSIINFPQNQPQTQQHANFIQYTNQPMENTYARPQQYNPNLYNYPCQPIRMPTSNLDQSLTATTTMTKPIDKLIDTNPVINPSNLTTSAPKQTTNANVVDMRHVQSENPRKISTAATKPRDMFSSLYGACDEDLSD